MRGEVSSGSSPIEAAGSSARASRVLYSNEWAARRAVPPRSASRPSSSTSARPMRPSAPPSPWRRTHPGRRSWWSTTRPATGSPRRLAERVPSARVLEELVNRGYGSACNRGARETRRPLLLFLNSDAYVRPGSVEALVRALDADEGAAAAGPRLLETDGQPPALDPPAAVAVEDLLRELGPRVPRGRTRALRGAHADARRPRPRPGRSRR